MKMTLAASEPTGMAWLDRGSGFGASFHSHDYDRRSGAQRPKVETRDLLQLVLDLGGICRLTQVQRLHRIAVLAWHGLAAETALHLGHHPLNDSR